jgi:hypothetical protein
MTLWLILMLAASVLCAFMLAMTLINLRFYSTPSSPTPTGHWPLPTGSLAVCIPARNEQANIEPIVRSLLASNLPEDQLQILVYDDHSTDATPRILARLCAEDPRIRVVPTEPLPDGWVGKQHACDCLGRAATTEYLLFTDADVRFTPDCLRLSMAEAQRLNADLLSTFPRQITGSLVEALVVPMIHFILFSWLPMPRMRTSKDPAASAGCGQFLLVRREAYLAAGRHAAFPSSMHDGIKMPRALRKAGFHTDLFDATDLCSCRMYRGAAATWRGFTKNAYEGLGSPALLVFLTAVHAHAHVLPWFYLVASWLFDALPRGATGPALVAIACALVQRSLLAVRFLQPAIGVALHPLGVILMTLIQWHSAYLALTGRRAWRGRTMGTPEAPPQLHAVERAPA